MELNQLVKELLDSNIIENQELGVNLLRSDSVSKEQKVKFIEGFIEDYTKGKINYFSQEQAKIFSAWVALYEETIKDAIKNRVEKL